jgi:signal transduction histidine kinase
LLLTERELAHVATVEKHLEPSAVDAGSRAKLQQVALNLLVNAKHAIEARPLPTGQRHAIRVATRTEGDSAVLEVSDTGCGIPPENVARLFEPFFTTKPVGIGSGLGLSVCATIVQRLGGRIDVESQIGVGTTFRVVIPCGASQSTSSTPCREAV